MSHINSEINSKLQEVKKKFNDSERIHQKEIDSLNNYQEEKMNNISTIVRQEEEKLNNSLTPVYKNKGGEKVKE